MQLEELEQMSKYERDKLSLDNQVVKSNKMIQRKI